jgi:hypothetical protein
MNGLEGDSGQIEPPGRPPAAYTNPGKDAPGKPGGARPGAASPGWRSPSPDARRSPSSSHPRAPLTRAPVGLPPLWTESLAPGGGAAGGPCRCRSRSRCAPIAAPPLPPGLGREKVCSGSRPPTAAAPRPQSAALQLGPGRARGGPGRLRPRRGRGLPGRLHSARGAALAVHHGPAAHAPRPARS